MSTNSHTEQLRSLIKLAANTTPRPWRYHQMLDGIEARALLDKSGYHFARVDDLQNGEFIEAASAAVPAIQSLLNMVGELVPLAEKWEHEAGILRWEKGKAQAKELRAVIAKHAGPLKGDKK